MNKHIILTAAGLALSGAFAFSAAQPAADGDLVLVLDIHINKYIHT